MRAPHSTSSLPFARSYWAQPGKLLAGFMPGDRNPVVVEKKLDALLDCGVTHITNLMEADETDHTRKRTFADYSPAWMARARARVLQVSWERRPIRDLSIPSVTQIIASLDVLDAVVAEGRVAYVHCWGGRGRTGTVIGCWLARHGERQPLSRLSELTAHARQHFPVIPETIRQQAFVQAWKPNQ